MHKGKPVIYIDGLGREREASVVDINPMHPDHVTVGWFDDNGDVKKVYDVPHFMAPSRQEVRTVKDRFGNDVQEGNPDLPSYPVNCWKERDEVHKALPADHPGFDHPFKNPESDQDGKRIEPVRSEYEKSKAEHQAEMAQMAEAAKPSAEDLDKEADEVKAKEATGGKPRIIKGSGK